jgi:SAM-dependent methyltransferase
MSDFLLEEFVLAGARVLDLGCGTGQIAIPLAAAPACYWMESAPLQRPEHHHRGVAGLPECWELFDFDEANRAIESACTLVTFIPL